MEQASHTPSSEVCNDRWAQETVTGYTYKKKHDINAANQLVFMQNPNSPGRRLSQQMPESTITGGITGTVVN